jgi:hypothetical protein
VKTVYPHEIVLRQYRAAIETMYRDHRAGLRRWLRRCFPHVCAGLIHDAVGDAFTDALDTERTQLFMTVWQTRPAAALLALIKQVAWRHLRGYLRKKNARPTARADDSIDLRGASPESLCMHRETLQRVSALIDEAATRLGGRRPQALHAALHTRLGGDSDAAAARAHGVPREYVNRAKRWIATRLSGD